MIPYDDRYGLNSDIDERRAVRLNSDIQRTFRKACPFKFRE
jgi:hypothetical protein